MRSFTFNTAPSATILEDKLNLKSWVKICHLETTLAILMESSNPECGEPSNSRLSLSNIVERPGNLRCPEEEEEVR